MCVLWRQVEPAECTPVSGKLSIIRSPICHKASCQPPSKSGVPMFALVVIRMSRVQSTACL